MRKFYLGAILAYGLILLISGCSGLSEGKNLDPASRDFFSKVRYIITKEERSTFLSLPASGREQFIKEFWQRRDPTPGTEVNEYKDRYFQRLEEANRLFKEGSTPGWLQERGRIYITLGPPDNRETYPRGMDLYGQPTEIWWYGNFPLVFIDENWSGNYRMTPLSAQQISEISRVEAMEKERGSGKTFERIPYLDFNLEIMPSSESAIFEISLPYKAIWFKAEGDNFLTTLDLKIEIMDESNKKAWEKQESFNITVPREEGLALFEKDYSMKVEAQLPPGKYTVNAEINNRTGGAKGKKSQPFTI